MTEDGRDVLGCGNRQPAIRYHGDTHGNAYNRGGNDAIEQRPFDIAGHQDATQQNGDDAQCRLGGEGTQAHKRAFFGHDDARILEADKRNEHANARRDGVPQVFGYAVENQFAYIEKGNEKKHEPLNEHDGQGLFP